MTHVEKLHAAKLICEAAKIHGLSRTLREICGKNVRVELPLSEKAYDCLTDELELSVRASNAIKRTGLFTIRDLAEAISNDKLSGIRNLGKKTENETKTKLLEYCYEYLTEREQVGFIYDVIERNCI